MKVCSCANTLSNTGQTNCQPLMSVMRKAILVPYYDSLGAQNKLSVTAQLTGTIVSGKINNSDVNVRWFPTPDLENIGGERADSVFDEAPSGKKSFIKQGARSMSFEIWDQGPEYKYQLDSARCTEFGVYIVDDQGNLIGMVPQTEDGYLYPIRIDKASWDCKLMMPTETSVMKLMVSFNWHNSMDDALLRTIAASDFSTSDAPNLLSIEGLLDVTMVVHTITTTTVKFSLFEKFGSRYKKNKVKGLVVADFVSSVTGATSKFRNSTDAADITISTVAEETGTETTTSGPGTYLATFTPAQTSADVMICKPSKNGYDFSDVVATTFTIP